MVGKRTIDLMVGMFMLAGLVALLVLSLKISGLTHHEGNDHYTVTAQFDNIGALKVGAPIRIAGVRVGEVGDVALDEDTYRAKVVLFIKNGRKLPVDTSASILTEGLLGANYVSLSPGYKNMYLHNMGKINKTHAALVLESLLGQLIFDIKSKKS